METIQIISLIGIALLGIPIGFFLKRATKEEMKPGRKWFKIISILSVILFFGSFIFYSGNDLALSLTTFAFIFFISVVPLFKIKRK